VEEREGKESASLDLNPGDATADRHLCITSRGKKSRLRGRASRRGEVTTSSSSVMRDVADGRKQQTRGGAEEVATRARRYSGTARLTAGGNTQEEPRRRQ